MIATNQQDQGLGQQPRAGSNNRGAHGRPGTSTRKARSTSEANRADSASAERGNALITTSEPGGSTGNRSLITWRNRRDTRCRTTEPPTALLTTSPTRGDRVHGVSGTRTCITTSVRPARRPCRNVREKSSRRVSRAVVGSMARSRRSGGQLLPALAATSRQDRAAGTGPHPEPEAVLARTTAVVRLKRALTLAHFSDLHFLGSAKPAPGTGPTRSDDPPGNREWSTLAHGTARRLATRLPQRVRSEFFRGQTGGTTRSRLSTCGSSRGFVSVRSPDLPEPR